MSLRILTPFLLFTLGLLFSLRHSLAAESLSLDGTWAFTINAAQLGRPASEWDSLVVPGNWDVRNEYAQHRGKGWYQRSFSVPKSWRGKRVRLEFGAVYESAQVVLNGVTLGQHRGGYTPFGFDVTENLEWDGPNLLTVCADNSFKRGAWWAWGGISRSVSLVTSGDIRVGWQHITATPDLERGTATVQVDTWVENQSGTPQDCEIETQVCLGGTQQAVQLRTEKLKGREARKISFTHRLERGVKLWHFDHPALYQARVVVRVNGQVQESREDRFGIRKIEVRSEGLFLNGEKVSLNGFNRVHDHRAYGNTEPEHLIRQDVDRMKQLGANFMRIMHAPSAPNLLDYLDEKGMLIFGEIPVWGGGDPNMVPGNPLTTQWLEEMIARDFNHPCIIGWSVGNELLEHKDYVVSMLKVVRRADPGRLASYVSFSGARDVYDAHNDPITESDLIMYNVYTPNPAGIVRTLNAKWPGRPVFLSEYGIKQFGERLESDIPAVVESWTTLRDMPGLIGAALWTYNDYRSDYPGSSPSQLRSWGVVDQWRNPKAAAGSWRRLSAPVARLSITAEGIELVPRGVREVPSYSLRGYRLVWTALDESGSFLAGDIIDLPEVAPGSKALLFPLPAAARTGARLAVQLLSPVGYSVAEAGAPVCLSRCLRAPVVPAPGDSKAELIARVLPLDRSCMVGYYNRKGDTGCSVEVREAGAAPTRIIKSDTLGAVLVTGLENGRSYELRLRCEAPGGASEWSSPRVVVPDGGRPPSSPSVRLAFAASGRVAVFLAPVDKAIAYRIRWGALPEESLLVSQAEPGPVLLPEPATGRISTVSVSAVGEAGESSPSAPFTVRRQ